MTIKNMDMIQVKITFPATTSKYSSSLGFQLDLSLISLPPPRFYNQNLSCIIQSIASPSFTGLQSIFNTMLAIPASLKPSETMFCLK